MSKLKALLQEQSDLTAEVEGVSKFMGQVCGHGSLTMTVTNSDSGDEQSIYFTEEDLSLELKVLAPLKEYLSKKEAELDEVNRRVAALEALA